MSLSGNPASRKRCAMASAAAVTLPTESVVLISISCLKISSASRRVASSAGDSCCACIEATNITERNRPNHNFLGPTSILHKDFRKKFGQMPTLKANRFVRQNQTCQIYRGDRTRPENLSCNAELRTLPFAETKRNDKRA